MLRRGMSVLYSLPVSGAPASPEPASLVGGVGVSILCCAGLRAPYAIKSGKR
jgi:hypothetical protein